ncbi:MAG: 2'-5' RNA ligase family protein [Anaeroplasmataceae bacterium]|nr:2'-5' RNA ligase family protein [Anaeroplasmataceae bacterium]
MNDNKFLTVFAVFDEETQKKLKCYQDKVLSLGYKGDQTMDIPFHISLGTYSVLEEEKLKEKIYEVCKENKSFEIKLNNVNRFNYRVLFIEPKINEELLNLHSIFDNDIFNHPWPWSPHATIFMGEEGQVKEAEQCLTQIFKPLNAKIVGIQMGEFFPTRMIIEEMLQK